MRTDFFAVMMIVAALMLCGCRNIVAGGGTHGDEQSAVIEHTMGYSTGKVTQGSWLELSIGMGTVGGNENEFSRYECTVPELDGVEGIIGQELEATWYKQDYSEPACYRCTLGLYVDSIFPSEAVFRQVELGIDTLLTQSFCYNDELEDLKKHLAQRTGYAPKSAQDILDRAKLIFSQFTKKNSQMKTDSAGFKLFEARVCIVAHRIYDKGDYASYIIEFSFDYNGSNGCPSWADYITVNKKTGHRLTTDGLVKKYGYARVCKSLRDAYVKAKCERNADLELYNCTGQELISLADGCAIVDEGVMFYYRPYVVGCGAEGEFNLVLDYPWP